MRSRLLLSTIFVTMIALPAAANTTGKQAGGVATGAHIAKGETVDDRIKTLHSELKITSGEEDKWKAVADAMHDNADKMEQMRADKEANEKGMSAKDDLATYQEFSQAHVDGLKNLRDAFDALYDSMPADQQKIADAVFAKAKH